MTVCKEIKRTYGLTFGQSKALTNKAKLRPDEKLRYRLAEEVKLTLNASRNWQEFSDKLTSYGIKADVRFRNGTTIPQGICFTKQGTTFKGSSRVSRVEESLREPMEITNPMLKVHGRGECSRNDSIYGALVYSIDTYKEQKAQKALIEDVQSGVQMN